MNKEIISDKEAIAIIILFLVGSTSIFGVGAEARKDIWLAIIVAILLVMPMLLVFARLHYIFPDKDFFDILEICLGKFLGKAMIVIYIPWLIFFAGDIFTNYSLFLKQINLPETPEAVPLIFMGFLCIWSIKEGIEVIGRWSRFFVGIPYVLLVIITLLLIPNIDFNNIRPFVHEDVSTILEGTAFAFTFPFIQVVVFTMFFSNFNNKKSVYKIYLVALLLAGIFILISSLLNTLVLGQNVFSSMYYASYGLARRIDIGEFITRVEALVAVSFFLGGFIKLSVLLLCLAKGYSKVFGFKDYRFIATPITLIVINFAVFQYEGILHYFEFNYEVWPYLFFPFQVIFPLIILIIGEFKKKSVKINGSS